MRKDWEEAKKKHKMQQEQARRAELPIPPPMEGRSNSNGVYDKDMDAMRCILYLHGGTFVSPFIVTVLNSYRGLLFRKC